MTMLLTKNNIAVVLFTALYTLIATVMSVSKGNYEFIYYIVVMIIIGIAFCLILRKVDLHPATVWLLSLWGLLHMAGGLMPLPQPTGVLYNFWFVPGIIKYDMVIHAFGFGVTAWVCFQTLATKPVTMSTYILAAFAACGFGALNEIIEFLATVMIPNTNVGDYVNNSIDLIANMTGAIVAMIIVKLTRK